MIPRSLRTFASCAVFALAATLFTSPESRAGTTFQVAQGWDLFQTDATATTFPGLGNLMGVPLGTYNFGTAPDGNVVGVQPTGPTDTIIQRLQTAIAPTQTAGAMTTINLQMVALQLETVTPVNFMGLGLDNYFITLDPGTPSTGTMTITWNASGLGGTFSSSLNVDFDIHKGSLNGAVINPGGTTLTLTSSGTTWSDLPPAGATQITDVNQYLSGKSGDRTQDFWVNPGPIVETHPTGAMHTAVEAGSLLSTVPEPSSLVMLSLGVFGVGALGWRRRGRVV
jgi:PEP-CTERM motif